MASYRVTDPSGRTIGYAHGPEAQALGILAVVALVTVLTPIFLLIYGVSVYWHWASSVLPISMYPNVNGLIVTVGILLISSSILVVADRLAIAVYGYNLGVLAKIGGAGAYATFVFVCLGGLAGAVPLLILRWLLLSESAVHSLSPWSGDLFPINLFHPYVASLMGLVGGPITARWNRGNGSLMSFPIVTALMGLVLPWVGMQVLSALGSSWTAAPDGEDLFKWNFVGTWVGGFLFGVLVLPLTRWVTIEKQQV